MKQCTQDFRSASSVDLFFSMKSIQEALSVTVRQDRLESLFEQALERITYLERQLVQQNGKMDSINKSSPMDRATGLPLPTSCADVYQNGHYLNNFFMVKGTSGMIETVFCDFRNSTGQGIIYIIILKA